MNDSNGNVAIQMATVLVIVAAAAIATLVSVVAMTAEVAAAVTVITVAIVIIYSYFTIERQAVDVAQHSTKLNLHIVSVHYIPL